MFLFIFGPTYLLFFIFSFFYYFDFWWVFRAFRFLRLQKRIPHIIPSFRMCSLRLRTMNFSPSSVAASDHGQSPRVPNRDVPTPHDPKLKLEGLKLPPAPPSERSSESFNPLKAMPLKSDAPKNPPKIKIMTPA